MTKKQAPIWSDLTTHELVTRIAIKLGMTKKKVVEFAVRDFAVSRSIPTETKKANSSAAA